MISQTSRSSMKPALYIIFACDLALAPYTHTPDCSWLQSTHTNHYPFTLTPSYTNTGTSVVMRTHLIYSQSPNARG
ncbi:hypothetical protein C8T65DRAFT_657396 [Cerioporus squamosus]|nr:hypothetical protein C8T65DRAFT_657396 [Cerioporus squamosus]